MVFILTLIKSFYQKILTEIKIDKILTAVKNIGSSGGSLYIMVIGFICFHQFIYLKISNKNYSILMIPSQRKFDSIKKLSFKNFATGIAQNLIKN